MGRKAGEDEREYKAAAGHISNGYHCIVFKGGSKESFCLSWHPCPKSGSSQLSHLCEQIRTSTLASSRTTNSTGAVSTPSPTASDTTANGDTACNTASARSIGRMERSVGLTPHLVTLESKP